MKTSLSVKKANHENQLKRKKRKTRRQLNSKKKGKHENQSRIKLY